MTRRRAYLVLVAAIVVLTIVNVATAPGPTLAGDGPYGTLALERVATDLGFDVRRAPEPPDRGTFVLAHDLRSPSEAAELVDWARDGGRLVVADPGSAVLDLVDVRPARRASGAFTGTARLTPACDLPEVGGVTSIEVRASDLRLRPEDGVAAATCTDRPDRDPLLVVVPTGEGTVVLLGGASPLQNELLDRADNAMYALRLLGDGDLVVLGTAVAGRPPTGLWAALPDGGRALLVAGVLAALVVVAAAWRRLGVPLAESAPTPLASSGLVDAVAALYRESGDRAHVARRLQEHVADVVRRRTGMPQDTSTDDVARMLAELTGGDPTATRSTLTRVPDGEDDLVAVALDLHSLLETLESR